MEQPNKMYLLIHTMTITESDYIIRAQFFHTFIDDILQLNNTRLIGRRLSFIIHPNVRVNRNKLNLQRLSAPSLKTCLKKNSARIKHHLRTFHIGSHNRNQLQPQLIPKLDETSVVQKASLPPPQPNNIADSNVDNINNLTNEQLPSSANPQQTTNWLTVNRFDKYLHTFSSFSGADMLRMTREDLIQICGHADGIRLYNALHSKTIAPKLTIYVCRDNTTVFNAVFLSTHSNIELLEKLSEMIGVPREQVSNMYMQGPQSIHVQLSNDVIRHIKEETMFSLEILQENGCYSFLLKPTYNK